MSWLKIFIQKTNLYESKVEHDTSRTNWYSKYIKSLLLKVVKEVEEGLRRKEANRIYPTRIYLSTRTVILGRHCFCKKNKHQNMSDPAIFLYLFPYRFYNTTFIFIESHYLSSSVIELIHSKNSLKILKSYLQMFLL